LTVSWGTVWISGKGPTRFPTSAGTPARPVDNHRRHSPHASTVQTQERSGLVPLFRTMHSPYSYNLL